MVTIAKIMKFFHVTTHNVIHFPVHDSTQLSRSFIAMCVRKILTGCTDWMPTGKQQSYRRSVVSWIDRKTEVDLFVSYIHSKFMVANCCVLWKLLCESKRWGNNTKKDHDCPLQLTIPSVCVSHLSVIYFHLVVFLFGCVCAIAIEWMRKIVKWYNIGYEANKLQFVFLFSGAFSVLFFHSFYHNVPVHKQSSR